MPRSRLILLAVAMLAAGAMLAWEVFWVEPEQHCVKHGGDWAAHFRACGRLVTLTAVR
jgi:hypothetical protein